MAAKKKFYVVWEGTERGICDSWPDCEAAIKGYSGAKYKAFPTRESAHKAFDEGPDAYWGTGKFASPLDNDQLAAIGQPINPSLCVDAARNSDTKIMEYRGVWFEDRSIAFQQGPFEGATNNIGEFLAIVHGLSYLSEKSLDHPVYSDSRTALVWVKRKHVRSTAMAKYETSQPINELVARAIKWIESHAYTNSVLKWHSQAWGENPADYGRK